MIGVEVQVLSHTYKTSRLRFASWWQLRFLPWLCCITFFVSLICSTPLTFMLHTLLRGKEGDYLCFYQLYLSEEWFFGDGGGVVNTLWYGWKAGVFLSAWSKLGLYSGSTVHKDPLPTFCGKNYWWVRIAQAKRLLGQRIKHYCDTRQSLSLNIC